MKITKLFLFLLFSLTMWFQGFTQEVKKVAILDVVDKTGNVSELQKMMVRSNISTAITNMPGYESLERLDISSIMDEQKFQRTGHVGDAEIKKMGEMSGANYVLIAEVAAEGKDLLISARIVNVETAKRSNESLKLTTTDSKQLMEACRELAAELLGFSLGLTISDGGKRSVGGSAENTNSRKSSEQNYTENAFGLNMQMVYVEGGEFMMGCTEDQGYDCNDYEFPARRVTVSSYYIGATEVTQDQWERVMGTTIREQWMKAGFAGIQNTYGIGKNNPMYCVNWSEAKEFCRKLSQQTGKTYALPTEEQWEYAARGGNKKDGTMYSGSNSINEVAWHGGNSGGFSHPVGLKKPNGLGIYDMSGNIIEWCQDYWCENYNSLKGGDCVESKAGETRVIRGGGYHKDFDADDCRVGSHSLSCTPRSRNVSNGFRVVMIP